MELPIELVKEFSNMVAPKKTTEENQNSTFYGTIHKENGQTFVKIDGFSDYTPVANTTETIEGDRVIVTIQNHQAIVNGNVTSPPSGRNATNYMKFDDGLIIGNVTDDELGGNVLIKSDEIDIRNGSIVNASFKEDEVNLGKNSDETVIKMCEGRGYVRYYRGGEGFSPCLSIGSTVPRNDDGTLMYPDEDVMTSVEIYACSGESKILLEPGYIYLTAAETARNSPKITFGRYSSEIYISSLLRIKRHGSEGYGIAVGTGDGGTNRGLYDDYNSAWMIHSDANNTFLGSPDYGQFKPYYGYGDTIKGTIYTSGFISNNKADVWFTIPLSKQFLGDADNTSFTVNYCKLKIRQNDNYLYGGNADTYKTPTKTNVSLGIDNGALNITAVMSGTTNVTNNSACGIEADISITFNHK